MNFMWDLRNNMLFWDLRKNMVSILLNSFSNLDAAGGFPKMMAEFN
jgi:hypothetical protein